VRTGYMHVRMGYTACACGLNGFPVSAAPAWKVISSARSSLHAPSAGMLQRVSNGQRSMRSDTQL
jgi:hypothetical protein